MTIVLPVHTRLVRRQRAQAAADESAPATGRVPRTARVLALAHHWRSRIRDGVVKDQAALAALVGISRARVTQVMDLLHLAPDIQEVILGLPDAVAVRGATRERALRAIAAVPLWPQQRAMWRTLTGA